MTQPTPPGWYQDPNGPPGAYRWWDGVNWTASTQPSATAGGPAGAVQYGGQYDQQQLPGQYAAQPPKQRNTGLIVGIICAVIIVACGATIAIVLASGGGDNKDGKGNPRPSNAASSIKMAGLQNDRATGITYGRPEGWQDDTKDIDGTEVGAEMLWGQYTCPNGKTCYAGVVYSGKVTSGTDLTAIVEDKLSDLVALRIGFGNGVKVSSSDADVDGHKAYTETQDYRPTDQQATPGTLRVTAVDLGNGTIAYLSASVNTQTHAPPAGTLDAIFRSLKTNT